MHTFARSIVETVRHPLVVMDGTLTVRAANPAFYRTFPGAPESAVGQALFEVIRERDIETALRPGLENIPTRGAFEGIEVEHAESDRTRRVLSFSARSIAAGTDERMLVLSIEDVTRERRERDELEERVRDRTRQLEAANRELEAFSFSVSHDLRAPLRAIEGFSSELQRTYAPALDERGRHYLQRIQAASQRMAALIDDLLGLSRLTRDAMACVRIDLSALARAVAAELAHAEPERRVELVVQPDLVVHGDRRLLSIALDNLLRNAWKFTARAACARVEVGRCEARGQPAYFVRDNGAGFDMAQASSLFVAFQRLHSEKDYPGTGVGLATVHRVIRRHGGEIWAEGRVGGGATFFFTLPAPRETS